MPDYSKGKIYMICSNDGDMEAVYYGSTCATLSSRMSKHRTNNKNVRTQCTSKIVFNKYGIENCHIEWLEDFPCKSKAELEHRENHYIRNNKSINFKGTKDSYSKEYHKQHSSDNYQANREAILARQKERRQQDPSIHKERTKAYYASNREEIRAKAKAKITCECGRIINRECLATHRKSAVHQAYLIFT